MIELIAVIFLIVGFLGILFLVFYKIPVLAKLSEPVISKKEENFFEKIKKEIKNLPVFKVDFYEILLEKFLSKLKILILKIENKTSYYLERLRKKSFKKNGKIKKEKEEKDSYWKNIKKTTKK